MERLREQYNKDIAPQLAKKFGFTNAMSVPKVQKIVINAGIGKFVKDSKIIDRIAEDLKKITGQAPVRTLARKSIAGFKIRENQVVGIMVTLRGERMYAFLDKLINIALPRVRDFRGVKSTGFDGRGNYHLGLKEQLVFPEISSEAIENVFGLEVSIITNSGKDDVTKELLTLMKFPFTQE